MVTKHKRGQHPKSLANLKPPAQPGEVRNPRGVNRKRPWAERYAIRSELSIPEKIRLEFNLKMGEEVLPKGATWADAAVLRRHMEALMDGGTPAARRNRRPHRGQGCCLRRRASGREGSARLFGCRREPEAGRGAHDSRKRGANRRNQ